MGPMSYKYLYLVVYLFLFNILDTFILSLIV